MTARVVCYVAWPGGNKEGNDDVGIAPVKIELLTPLWTGDAQSKGTRVLETGILGSLRWWYEAILRGLGFYACDAGNGACPYDEKVELASICPGCRLFGCTGYGRRFRLKIEGTGDACSMLEIKLKHPESSEHKGWRVPANLAGHLRLSFLPMHPGKLGEIERTALHYTLGLIERYGALGGKTSQGQGIVRVTDWGDLKDAISFDAWVDLLRRQVKFQPPPESIEVEDTDSQPARTGVVPDLRNFVGATIILEDAQLTALEVWNALPIEGKTIYGKNWLPSRESKWVPSAPAVRAHLRGWLRDPNNFPGFQGSFDIEHHRLMGTTKSWGDPNPKRDGGDRPKGSEIFVSHLYKIEDRWTMRVFAFIPREGNEVDLKVCKLISDASSLQSQVQQALSNLPVQVRIYPTDMAVLIDAGREEGL